MSPDTPPTIHLKDYKPTPYIIERVELDVHLAPTATRTVSTIFLKPRHAEAGPLAFDGEELTLKAVAIDGHALSAADYTVHEEGLVITAPPQRPFTLTIEQTCDPQANTQLSGLYLTNGKYCTQMEAEGFRRFAYFYDRPDVMATYRVRVSAPNTTCPVLLSNGNLLEAGDIYGADDHFAVWDDPHPKPTYLFALVAGDLVGVFNSFTTMSGREVKLGIYVERGKENRCAWAMESLKTSMRWDEERFGREYDLDVFNIVAVSDFNMGAMENKGLNVFNDKYILALPETATDTDHVNIEAIIAHEYFHNWTGNRITCRDWFQLCLKEGLTVFRDQEFTGDVRSRAVERISDVKNLRARQFPEDAGPLAHPVRPAAYMEINNFYTATVYEKGAELCRMMQTLIGGDAFRKAMDLYFERHDGEAATVEDFVRCMADASGRDMGQFMGWYEQAGTPEVTVKGVYNAARKTFDLSLQQTTAPTPGQTEKRPVPIPLGLGLVGPDGADMPLHLDGHGALNAPMIELNERSQTFRFRDIPHRPVLSLNRGFSAPVRITSTQSLKDKLFLMGHDGDSFNRWEAGQSAGNALIMDAMEALKSEKPLPRVSGYAEALRKLLADPGFDDAYKALMLVPPSETDVATLIGKDIDPGLIHEARKVVRAAVSKALKTELEALWLSTAHAGPYTPDPRSTGRRALRYAALTSLAYADKDGAIARAEEVLAAPQSMTDEMGAMSCVIIVDGPWRQSALDRFYDKHRDDHLLVDQWFALNAMVPSPATPAAVRALTKHPEFKLTNPNRVRGLLMTFTLSNPVAFHAPDGGGYRLLADMVLDVDPLNPQVAARVATSFGSWRGLEAKRRDLCRAELQRVLATPKLSRDTYEIVSKTLGAS